MLPGLGAASWATDEDAVPRGPGMHLVEPGKKEEGFDSPRDSGARTFWSCRWDV